MADRVDLDALKSELYSRRADRREWHETVVLALQEKASITQADILSQMADLKYQGMVEKYTPLWIGNVILVKALPSALDILVRRADVDMINPDYQIESIQPVSKGGDEPILAGVEIGLEAIQADLVWDMGFTGEGRLVSHLDTGVDGNHTALNARWRGFDPRYSNNPEWAWFDPVTGTTFPFDAGSHGTHTMGTICGLGESTGDTIGVAFGAEWMSAGVIDRVSIPQTVADALLSFQWIVDPDGDPSTVWDVPDVCSNSWGVTTGHGYPPCDQTFWTVLDGCEAAGIVVLFAAGNEGFSGCWTEMIPISPSPVFPPVAPPTALRILLWLLSPRSRLRV
jgi:bacillopeptidase F